MSVSIVVVPIVIASWPAIAGAVAAAAATMGYQITRDKSPVNTVNRAQLEMANVEAIADTLGRGEQVRARKGDVSVIFQVDARGKFAVHVDGPLPKAELERIGKELGGAVVQQYVHRRLSEELAHQGFVTVEEERAPDRTVHMRVRRYT